MIVECGYTNEIIEYINKWNSSLNQKSYFLGETKDDIKELIDEGALLYVYKKNDVICGASILDIVEDNNSIELSGPYGDSFEIREEILNMIKEKYSSFQVRIFVDKNNELLNMFEVHSINISMQKEIGDKEETKNVSLYDDEIEVISLHDHLFPNAYSNGESLISNKDYQIIVYKVNDEVKGYLAYQKDELYIDFIGVRENARRQGIASSLVLFALSKMKKGSIVKLTVSEDNVGAINLYRKLGFICTDYISFGTLKH